jgi:hypothetical protein
MKYSYAFANQLKTLYYIRDVKHFLVNKTFQRAHVTFQHNFSGYVIGVIFGYIYHYAKPTGVKSKKVINTLLL